MAGRPEVKRSAAYLALSDGGKKVLHVIEDEVRRGVSTISLERLAERADLCRSSVRRGIKQAEALGLISVTLGPRHANEFRLCDRWKSIDASEAARLVAKTRLPTPPRATSVPPRAVKTAKVPVAEVVEQPRIERAAPSMPRVAWLQRAAGFDQRSA